jgi:hypothetical protein
MVINSDSPERRREVQIPTFAMSGPEALAKRLAEWEARHGDGQAEREDSIREIQPKLVGIPLRRIAEVTGFSLRYAALVHDGEYALHPVHA